MKMKANQYIAKFLQTQGVDFVFEMAGGMITHLLDAIHALGGIEIVSVHHEQAAAFAADAYGRITGKVGVAFATSGPGATNLLTGIASCHFDSSPAIFITGQVNIHEQKGDRPIRQLGFQETDIVAMAETITKKCYRVTNAEDLTRILPEAYQIAISDRPGPVLIDLPMNLQRLEIDVDTIQVIKRKIMTPEHSHDSFDLLLASLQHAKKPLILAGGGINAARYSEPFLQLVDQLQIPVVTSLLGVDTIAYDHPLRVGFIGSYGNRWANIALGNCDFLLVLGSRLDIRQTGADVESFANNKKIFHVDCDQHEINNRLKNCFALTMDISEFIDQLTAKIKLATPALSAAWLTEWKNEINALRNTWPDTNELQNIQGLNPNCFMHTLSRQSQHAAGYVADVGNHQMWAAQSLEMSAKQFFMTSGGMGAMGFALPAAMGASLACQKRPVIVIAGDGGFQLNMQELQTIVHNKIPLKMIILNNNSLGMIRQFQDNYFEGRYQSTYWGYSAPNFELIAKAYGLRAQTIATEHEVAASIDWFWEYDQPCLLQVMVDLHTNAYPKIAFGRPITEMEPFVRPIAMEGT